MWKEIFFRNGYLAAVGITLGGLGCAFALTARYQVAGGVLPPGALMVSLGIATLGALAIMVIFALSRRQAKDAFCAIVDLCRDEGGEMDPAHIRARFGGGEWRDILTEIAERISSLHERTLLTEQQQVASEMRIQRIVQELELNRVLVDAMPDAILVTDSYGKIESANPAACKLFGLSPEAIREDGRTIVEAIQLAEVRDVLLEDLRHKRTAERVRELKIGEDPQNSKTLRVLTRKIGEGPRQFLVAVIRDMTDLQQLRQRHAEFVSAVSHEMKTPLAGIRAYVELLVDGDAEDEETREEFLETIQCQADRLQRLIDNLLNLARIEAGVIKVKKEPRALNEILDDAFRIVAPQGEAKQITMHKELSSLYLPVLGDRDLLLQAAINLLSNAVKYTPNGGEVTLRSRVVGDAVVFEVEDTGVGLSEEDCKRVFERFYRVKKDSQMASGTGLGLPLAKHIVEDVHGGTLSVKSELGKGSVFVATIPMVNQHEPVAAD
ncbi:MAG: PAS domain S-box protein [Planctomycetota bacterium]|nr:MAG: PAS domain S-box protein [Planctomycetota bacterium]